MTNPFEGMTHDAIMELAPEVRAGMMAIAINGLYDEVPRRARTEA